MTTRSARLAIHFSMPWMWACGCLSTQPWWRPYSVAWIVTTSGQRKRRARWSPALATSQSWPWTTSKSYLSPSSTPAASASRGPALERAARELFALQSSDWAFLMTRELAADYPLERVRTHVAELSAALGALDSAPLPDPELRSLAPRLDLAPLVSP